MASTSVKVALRIRPLTAKELLEDASECVSLVGDMNKQVLIGTERRSLMNQKSNQHSFTFDNVFDTLSSQHQVYEESSRCLVENYLSGFNATILAYGQTGSGKTFTMGTGLEFINDEEAQGIIPRAIDQVFHSLSTKILENPNGFKYTLHITFIELYNEELLDLLNPRPRSENNSTSSWGGLTIREDMKGNIIWGGIREQSVTHPEDVLGYLQKGSLCRTTGSTDMNAQSSRSHAIFSMVLKQQKWIPPKSEIEVTGDINPITYPDGSWHKISSKFHFVDLAGSERLKRTNAQGDRKAEGISINEGLFVLGKVISALGDDSKKNSHVPYRDSKLTRLLQDSLGGNSQTLVLACVSPSSTNFGESLNTLQYANRAKNIKNKVVINEEWSTVVNEQELKHLRATVSKLQSEIAMIKSGGEIKGIDSSTIKLNNARTIKHDRQVQQSLVLQQNLQEEISTLKEENTKLLFEREKTTYKCHLLSNRIDFLSQTLESKVSERMIQPKTEESIEYASELCKMRLKFQNSQDQVRWYNEVILRISNGQKFPDEMNTFCDTVDEDEDAFIKQQIIYQDNDIVMTDAKRSVHPIDEILLKIQMDVRNHTELTEQFKNKDNEYEAIKHAYEQRLVGLQDQLVQVKKERDLALTKLKPENYSSIKEKAGSINLRIRLDKENKRLDLEVNDLRKKLNARSNTRVRSEQITRTLKNSIQTLKSEKNLLSKKLKDEASKNRESLEIKIKELATMKKKQEKRSDIIRRNAFQLNKKDDTSMKQSSSMESFLNEDDMVVKHVHQNLKSSKHESSQLQSSVRCDAVDVRTRDKKDLLEQWLQICQRSKQKHFQIESLNIDKNQLVQEQLELASEREKCVIVDGHTTGVFDASKPQYMDERLLIIDNDIMVIEERIYDLTLSSTHVSNDGSYIQDFDHGWQEVLKIVEGLELDEFRLLTRTMISELVDLRALMYDSQIQMSEKETMMYELRASFDLIRNAAIEASMDYERKNKQAMIHSNKIIDFIVNCYEHESFPKTLVDFLSETNLEDINRHSTGSNVLAEHYQCDNECTQEYRTLSIDLNKKIETPKMTRIQKNAIQLPTNQQTPMQDDSKRILRSERLVNLQWKQLDFLSGMKLEEPQFNGDISNDDSISDSKLIMSGIMQGTNQHDSTSNSRPAILDSDELKSDSPQPMTNIIPDKSVFIETSQQKERQPRQITRLIDDEMGIDNAGRRKSFDKILNIGKTALKWARNKTNSRSRDCSPKSIIDTLSLHSSPTKTNLTKSINLKQEDTNIQTDCDSKRTRTNSGDYKMNSDDEGEFIEDDGVIQKSKLVVGAENVFSRLATAHTKASEFKKKQKFMNNS